MEMATVSQQPAGAGWMEAPEKKPGVPDGLEYLDQIDQLLIHQQVELVEALTGIDTKNKYAIKNSMGQQVYFAYEESGFWSRCCCTNERGFVIHVVDNLGKEVIRVKRQFKCCACGCCWCANIDCCAWELEVESPPGTPIGTVRDAQSKWKPHYHVLDASGNAVLKIRGPCCPCQDICCTADVDFKIMALDGVTQVGKISKQWAGLVKEWMTKADNFGVSFPQDLDVKAKALMIGAAFLIDFMFFEEEENS